MRKPQTNSKIEKTNQTLNKEEVVDFLLKITVSRKAKLKQKSIETGMSMTTIIMQHGNTRI